MSEHATTAGRRIRRLFTATAVALLMLWSYAAYLTGADAADLLRVRALAETLGQPTDRLISDLQTERRLTAGTIAGGPQEPSALTGARTGTDRTVTALRDAAGGTDLRLLTAGPVHDRADALLRRLDGLADLRADADAGRSEAVTGYDQLIDVAFAVYGPEWGTRENRLAAETRSIVALARTRELLAREDTLLTAALTAGRPSADDRRRLAELIEIRRYAGTEAVVGLPGNDQDAYLTLVQGPRFAALRSLEDRLLHPVDSHPEPSAEEWQAASAPALAELHDLVRSTARQSAERATPGAALLVVRTGAVLGLGLVALVTLLLAGARALRRIAAAPGRTRPTGPAAPAGELRRPPVGGRPGTADRGDGGLARHAALDGRNDHAPGRPITGVRNGHATGRPAATGWGERDSGAANTAGPGRAGGGAVSAAGPGRAGGGPVAGRWDEHTAAAATRELFLRLTQRNQVLLREQLNLLDLMERREHDAEEAAELFQLDHLATRLRRNVEKLVTLAGARPARRWRRPVPLLDVARGAVAEVADYQRVLVAPHWPWHLAGPAVTDVIHLLAELVENALVFSPAQTTVRMAGEHRPGGCAVVVTDDGPGLAPAALAAANRTLADPPMAGPPSGRTGLYAAALLAARCGARVSLQPGPRGGTAAIVLLPSALVTPTGPDAAAPGPGGPRSGPSARPSAGPGSTGDLPVRTRYSGSGRPGPGRAGTDTVEIPAPRAARGRS
ncbi:nitrate- and nitrite sensing domain-containing protein [Micromonospora avicenniae]|uniref:nitrate- and nitrite sensing domain-containing protein n=1 Tax=Micromonospora avicenniae TaxID=1198245 RepID=UPI003419B81D